MAMTGAGMAAAIKTQIMAIPGINITTPAELTSFCNAIGAAIVTYIQANAQVSTTDGSTITGTVTTGVGAGGLVTGTGTGTGTGTIS